MFSKAFFDNLRKDHMELNSAIKLTLDDGSSFNVKHLNALEAAVWIQFQEAGRPPITRFIPYERIRFVDLLAPDKPPNIFEMLLTNPEVIFREVPEDTAVRPLLNSDDLKLVRRALISLVQYGTVEGDRDKATRLFARILRKIRR
jgi:hypothetical protein